jgi:hypothetical protein
VISSINFRCALHDADCAVFASRAGYGVQVGQSAPFGTDETPQIYAAGRKFARMVRLVDLIGSQRAMRLPPAT